MSKSSTTVGRLTRLGFHCLLLGSFAIFGGAFRGFNLLLVLAAILMGTMVIQWRWSRRNLSYITARRRLPRDVFAGQPFAVRVRLHNANRFMSAWMIRVQDSIIRVSHDEIAEAKCGLASIRAGQTETADYDCLIAERGQYRFGPTTLETTFPFSLFRCRKTIQVHDDLYVLPRLLDIPRNWHQGIVAPNDGLSSSARRARLSDGEFYGLREWRIGDSPKLIHWRTTARLNDPCVRQFEQKREIDLCIMIDAYANSEAEQQFAETAISFAASVLVSLETAQLNRIVFGTAAAENHVVVAGSTELDRHGILVHLAQLQISNCPKIAEAIDQATQRAGSTAELIVVSPRSQSDALAQADSVLNQKHRSRSSSNLRWINVRDDSFANLLVRAST